MGLGQIVAVKRREHELAGDARAGTFARAAARRQQREFLRRNWLPVLAFCVLVCAVTAVTCLFTSNAFVRGVLVGLGAAALPGVIWPWTVQVTGTAPLMMGDQAEQWTAQELRKGRRHGWRVVNHLLLRGRGDIDHVLVGPAGVWAVETKWSSRWPTDLGGSDVLRSAATRTCASARSLRLWSPLRKLEIDVRPLVVLWGGDLGSRPEHAQLALVDGVPVVAGRALRSWVSSQDRSALDEQTVAAICSTLDGQARLREAADRAANPMPTSLARYLSRTGAVIVGASVISLVISAMLGQTQAPLWVPVVCTTLMAIALVVSLGSPRLLLWAGVGVAGTISVAIVGSLVSWAVR